MWGSYKLLRYRNCSTIYRITVLDNNIIVYYILYHCTVPAVLLLTCRGLVKLLHTAKQSTAILPSQDGVQKDHLGCLHVCLSSIVSCGTRFSVPGPCPSLLLVALYQVFKALSLPINRRCLLFFCFCYQCHMQFSNREGLCATIFVSLRTGLMNGTAALRPTATGSAC